MRRFQPSRAIVAAVMMTAVWLFSPAAILGQVIQVQPYVQPGDGSALTGSDVKVVRWLTDQTPGFFIVEYFDKEGEVRTARPERIALDFKAAPPEPKKDKEKDKAAEPAKEKEKKDPIDEYVDKTPKQKMPAVVEMDRHFYRYTAKLEGLPFNSDITYRVKHGNKIIREATFRTRATEDRSVRCVLMGDMAQGWSTQNEIAYRVSLEKPAFLMALGDIVYPKGRVAEYAAYFWDTYDNVPKAGLKTGAPLMASVPFYPLLGNHDIGAKLNSKTNDALGIYYFFAPPRNGPGEGPWNTLLDPKEPAYEQFKAATADSFPFIDTYSFDNGPAHFTVINTNRPLTEPAFQKWLVNDLKTTKAKWKIVCFHIPGFQSSKHHYPEQQLRQLQPIFEECRVDLTFAGHVHNYQRTVPIKFVPKDVVKEKKKFLVNGAFTLDTRFDGLKNTRADGVIHIVAGGGGAGLYGPAIEKTSEWIKKSYGTDNYVDFTAKMVVDKHSYVVLDLSPARLDLRAMAANGTELDRISLTK